MRGVSCLAAALLPRVGDLCLLLQGSWYYINDQQVCTVAAAAALTLRPSQAQ